MAERPDRAAGSALLNDAAGHVPCSICGGSCLVLFRVLDINRRTSAESFEYRKCQCCGVVFLKDPPADNRPYYRGNYFSPPKSLSQLQRYARRNHPKLEIVRKFATGGRLLEVGPGIGSFAWLAKAAGVQVAAIEPDERGCAYLKNIVGVDVCRTSTPERTLASTKRRYDVVALWHAIEHLPNPWSMLSQSVRVLNDGGILVIATPNPSSWQFKKLGPGWPHLDAPRHLWLMPLETMSHHLESLGAPLVWATTDDADGRSWNRFGWSQWILNFAPDVIGSTLLAKAIARGAGYVIAATVRPWESVELSGSAYTAVFRKRAGASHQRTT